MATEEVILKQDVRSLGDRGEVVKVAAGYARNYLFPRSLALPATAANKKQVDEMRAAAAKEAARLRNDASKLADSIGELTMRLVAKAGDSNVLFGSIGVRDIAEALEGRGFPIDRHRILLEKPIKEVGDYDIRLHLYKDVKKTIKVEVRAEGREDEPLVKPKTDEELAAEAFLDPNAPPVVAVAEDEAEAASEETVEEPVDAAEEIEAAIDEEESK
ncbi:MAG: 50S ribosomal protein L9 [Bryobacterales bacterium]